MYRNGRDPERHEKVGRHEDSQKNSLDPARLQMLMQRHSVIHTLTNTDVDVSTLQNMHTHTSVYKETKYKGW